MTAHLIRLAAIACVPVAHAAVTIDPTYSFDWLQYQDSDTTLRDQSSAAIASLSFDVRKGNVVQPASSLLDAAEWAESVPLEASGGNAGVVATSVQVIPDLLTSEADYTLKIQSQPGKSLSGMILAIGGLDAGSKITVSCHNSGGVGGNVGWIGSSNWESAGLGLTCDQTLTWDSLTSALQPAESTSGDSSFGFFRLPDSPVDRLELAFSSTASSFFGDSLQVGLALVTVPEPSSLALGLISTSLLLQRRRRTLFSLESLKGTSGNLPSIV